MDLCLVTGEAGGGAMRGVVGVENLGLHRASGNDDKGKPVEKRGREKFVVVDTQ